jgi:hypothetical protein
LGQDVQVNRFRTFAQNRQNGFVALGNCFIKVSLPTVAPDQHGRLLGIDAPNQW